MRTVIQRVRGILHILYRNILVIGVPGVRWVSRLENENRHILHKDNLVSSMRSVNQLVGRRLHIMNRNILIISVRGVRWVSRWENEDHHILHIDNLVNSLRSGAVSRKISHYE